MWFSITTLVACYLYVFQVVDNDFTDIVIENKVTNNQPVSANTYILDEEANTQPVPKKYVHN